MRKTRKQKNLSSMCCDATFTGINQWYKAMFEKLGWMILAKHYGMIDKITTYKMSLERLKSSIEKKRYEVRDHDKKEDLKIMLENVEILIDHANKDF